MRKRKTMKRFVGLIMAAALIIGMFPFAAFADDASDMPDAVDGKITLSSDVTLTNEFVVNEGESVTIDLAGHTITNASGKNTIVNKGTLVINDSSENHTGVVDNVSHGKAAVYNYPTGTVTLNGGTYDRSHEAGSDSENNGGNSFYTLKNFGTMIINDGVTVQQDGTSNSGTTGKFSSLVANGWQNVATAGQSGKEPAVVGDGASLTINGGTFKGGLNTVKNDDCGTTVINNGTFENYVQAVVQNHHITTINGGTFTAGTGGSVTYGIYNCGCAAETDIGTLTVTGGTFSGATYGIRDVSTQNAQVNISGGSISGTTAAILKDSTSKADISITGGTFSSDVDQFTATGYACTKSGESYSVDISKGMEADASASNDTANAVVGGSFSGEENGDNVDATNSTLTITATTGTNGDANDSVSASNVTINNASLTNANGQNVVLSVAKNAEDTSPLTYTVTATADGTEVYSASNAAGGITISVPYTKNDSPSVFYVGANGLEDMHATLEGDVLSWVAPHFSDYVVLTEGDVAAVTIDGTTTAYTSLNDAITAANVVDADQAVVVDILGDVTVPTVQSKPANSGALNISRTMTINGNGHTISYTGEATATENGTTPETGQFINVDSSASNVTIQDLTINASDVKHAVQFYQTTGGTLDNVTINGASWTAVQVNGSTGIKLVDCTLNPAEPAYANIEYSMGSGVETIPSVSLENVTGNNNGAFIWVDDDTVANMKTALSTEDNAVVQARLQQTIRNTNDYGAAASVTVEWSTDNPSTITIPSTYQPPYTGKYSYEVTVDKTTNGSISVDKYVTEGDKVTITVTPDKAYMLDALTVTDKNGDEVTLTDNKDGTYTFTMPSSNVKIVATFAEDPNYEEPSEPETPSMPFTDVNAGDWFYDVVQYAYDNGLMTGTSATTFEPNTSTTRGMIVAVLNRLEGGPTAEAAGFTDVNDDDWYADAVNWAASVGIVNGFEDSTFRANDPITREQMAAILYNYADYKGYDMSERADLSGYADADSISSWALDTLEWANAEGLITGMSADTIAPQGQATRAQVAAMFQRFLTAEK